MAKRSRQIFHKISDLLQCLLDLREAQDSSTVLDKFLSFQNMNMSCYLKNTPSYSEFS